MALAAKVAAVEDIQERTKAKQFQKNYQNYLFILSTESQFSYKYFYKI